jgi:DeoR family transcriptional regulator, fructose operon transcriptional repressor
MIKPKLKTERHDEILAAIQDHGVMSVPDLAKTLDVSEITVRRDLDELDGLGYLERVRGGARLRSVRGPEPPVVQRQTIQVAEKQAIGKAAADLVSDRDVIAIESGSTTYEIAVCLAQKSWQQLTVITNSFMIAEVLLRVPGIQVLFIGGLINSQEMGAFGALAVEMVNHLRTHKLFIGCRGIDPEMGIFHDLNAESEVMTVKAMIQVTAQVIVVADHSKFNDLPLIQTAPITTIDVVVTDHQTPNNFIEKLEQKGVRCVVAKIDQIDNSDAA